MLVDPAKALDNAREAEALAIAVQDISVRRVSLANARWMGAEALLRLNEGRNAERLADSALALAQGGGDRELLANIQLTRGGIFGDQVRIAEALSAYQAAHRLYVESNNRRGQAVALQSIANLYLDGHDFENADRYYNQSEEAFSDDPTLLLTLYNNRGASLVRQGRRKEAVQEYLKAMEIARTRDNVVFQIRIADNLGRAYLEMNRIPEATAVVQLALRLTSTPATAGWRRLSAGVAARLAYQRGRLLEARKWIDESFAGIDLEDTNATFRDAHVTAYEIYNALGESKLALVHLQALRRLTDEQTRLAASANTALMAARFDFANQELRIARLKAEELRASIALERSQARFQRILFFSLGGAAILILGLLSFGVVTLRRSRNQIRAANVELEASNDALAKALAAKTEFLATTSHEIRTPLNGILGMAQVMLADRTLPGEQVERVRLLQTAGLTMRSLVDDILDMAKMETGNLTIDPRPVDLKRLLTDASRMWAEQAAAKGLAFDLDLADSPGWVETDAERVRQIVLNLLSNALKFTSQGTVRLSVRHDASQIRIDVSDSGIGIPVEKHAEIFESFRQADSTTTRQFGGTGLGLAICRSLAGALGGGISVASEPGVGSTFTVTLPLVHVDAPEVDRDGVKGALVILERNPIARSMLKTLLMPRSGEILFADDPGTLAEMITDGSRVLIDAASLGDGTQDVLAALSSIEKIVSEQGVDAFVLWREPDEQAVAAIETMKGIALIRKPIAGPALVTRIFGEGDIPDQPLVTRAA